MGMRSFFFTAKFPYQIFEKYCNDIYACFTVFYRASLSDLRDECERVCVFRDVYIYIFIFIFLF